MAVERIVATWLHFQHTKARFQQSQKDLGWAKFWLRRLEVADKLHREAVKSLLLVRELLPAAVPTSLPAIVDARSQSMQPEAGDTTELPVSAEIMGNGPGTNRIANLVACPGNTQRFTMDDQAGDPPKLNGHHHQLEDLLANGSNGHSKQKGSI